MNNILAKSGVSLGVIGLLLSLSNYPLQINLTSSRAQASPLKPKKSKPKFWLPPVAQNLSVGTNRTSAGSRGSDTPTAECPAIKKDLTALAPQYEIGSSQDKLVWGMTASKHPTLWFYMPYTKNAVSQVSFELSLPSERNRIVYKTLIKLPQQPGFIDVPLPQTIPPLAINKFYKWELGVSPNCPTNSYVYVNGWIQRVNIDSGLSKKINQATPAQQAVLYAEKGFWYDALTILAQLHRTKPQDSSIAEDWTNLMNSVDLGELASEPFSPLTRTQRGRSDLDQ